MMLLLPNINGTSSEANSARGVKASSLANSSSKCVHTRTKNLSDTVMYYYDVPPAPYEIIKEIP